ncbi:MAG: hypothetical protein WD739_11140 [Actinomycetota bacterium]
MSVWEEFNVRDAINEALRAVPVKEDPHAFGRPCVSAYQLAVGVEQAHPEIRGWSELSPDLGQQPAAHRGPQRFA